MSTTVVKTISNDTLAGVVLTIIKVKAGKHTRRVITFVKSGKRVK